MPKPRAASAPSLMPVLRSWGGIASVRELDATQSQQRALARAASRGMLIRVRQGVYAVPDAHPDLLRAATMGGRLTGVSALTHLGLWVPPRHGDATLHVEVRVATTVPRPPVRGTPHQLAPISPDPHRPAPVPPAPVPPAPVPPAPVPPAPVPPAPHRIKQTRFSTLDPARFRVYWTRERTAPRFGLAPLEAVLARASDTLPLTHAVAVLDSALRCTPLTPIDVMMLARDWRPAARAAAALADERSESGTESVLRVLLHQAGIHARPQAPLPISDHARADLLIGDRLLIECDSEAHHAEPKNRRADLRRDEVLVALGYLVLRLDYQQVHSYPAGVVATIAALVERGAHLSARPTRVR